MSMFRGESEISRRQFVEQAALSLLGLTTLPQLARGAVAPPVPYQAGTANAVIYLFMAGGMTHVDTFDLKPENKRVQGPIEALKSNVSGIRVGQHFRHLSRQMDKVAVINSMHTTQGAHRQGQYYMHTSHTLRGTIQHPCMGSWLTRLRGERNPTLPGAVLINGPSQYPGSGFLESKYSPLRIGDPAEGLANSQRRSEVSQAQFARRLKRLQAMNAKFSQAMGSKQTRAYTDIYDQAVRLMNSADLQVFDLAGETAATRSAYGENPFGQGCLLARRLVERDVRFVEVQLGGWDFHQGNFERLDDKAPILDRGLAALLADLDQRGLLDSTLVVLATEFGRTPIINDRDQGRDHYPKAFSCALAGGGIQGGQVYGKTDASAMEIAEQPVTVPDLNATIAYALGLPLEHVIHSPSGRPFTVANKGTPVYALF